MEASDLACRVLPLQQCQQQLEQKDAITDGASSSSKRWSWVPRGTWLVRLAGLAVLLAGVGTTLGLALGKRDLAPTILAWIDQHEVAGAVIFMLLYVWWTVMFLPPAVLGVAAGALFNLPVAVLIVWVAAVVGETLAFVLGRFLLRKWVRQQTAAWPTWQAMQGALREDGWKLVVLLRLSPLIPVCLVNYALGTSSLPFQQYLWPSVVGILPNCLLYAWMGSLVADLSEVVAGGGKVKEPPAARIALMVFGAVSAVAAVVLTAVYTKRAIDRRVAHAQQQQHPDTAVQQVLQPLLSGAPPEALDGTALLVVVSQEEGGVPHQHACGRDAADAVPGHRSNHRRAEGSAGVQ